MPFGVRAQIRKIDPPQTSVAPRGDLPFFDADDERAGIDVEEFGSDDQRDRAARVRVEIDDPRFTTPTAIALHSKSLMNGTKRIYVVGEIHYRDIFGHQRSPACPFRAFAISSLMAPLAVRPRSP